jgi:MFS transporter, MHS family, shikimate and dehydroshikimate transport protein
VPVLVSFLLIGVSLYVRLRVAESPLFRALATERRTVKLPVLEALRRYPRNLLIGVGAHIADTAAVYLYATFTVSYASGTPGIRGAPYSPASSSSESWWSPCNPCTGRCRTGSAGAR